MADRNRLELEIVAKDSTQAASDSAKSQFRSVEQESARTAASMSQHARQITDGLGSVHQAAKDVFETITGGAAAAGAWAAAHTGAAESVVNGYRAVRLSYAAYASAVSGSIVPLAFAGITVGAGIAIQKIGELVLAQDALNRSDSLFAAKNNVTRRSAETLRFASDRVEGQTPKLLAEAYGKLTPSTLRQLNIDDLTDAGSLRTSPEILGSALEALGNISDPLDRARKTFSVFGQEVGEKLLPFLNERLAENTRFIREWSIETPDFAARQVTEMSTDLHLLGTAFDTTFDKIAFAFDRNKRILVTGFAEMYLDVKSGVKTIDDWVRAHPVLSFLLGQQQQPQEEATGKEAVDKARELIGLLGAGNRHVDPSAYGNPAAQYDQVLGIVARRQKDADPDTLLSEEKSRLSKLLESKDVGDPLVSQAIVLTDKRITALKKQIDAAKAAKDAASEIDQQEKRAHQTLIEAQKSQFNGISPTADAISTYKTNLSEFGGSSTAREDLSKAFQINLQKSARAESGKQYQEYLRDSQDKIDADLNVQAGRFRRDQVFEQDTLNLRLKNLDEQYAYETTVAQQSRDSQLRGVEGLNAQTLSQKLATEQAKFLIEQDYLLRVSEIENEQIAIRRDREIDLQRSLAEAGVISASQFAERQDALVDSAYQQSARVTLNAQSAIQAAQESGALRSANLVREHYLKVFDGLKHSAEGLIDASFKGIKSLADAALQLLKVSLFTPIKDALSNQIAARLTSLVTGHKVSLETEKVEGTGAIAGIRRGLASIGVGATPRFDGGINDVQLVGGAVPVIVTNGGGQQAAQAGSSGSFNLGTALGLGLATLGGSFAKSAAPAVASEALRLPSIQSGFNLPSGGGGLFSGSDSSNPLIFHANGGATSLGGTTAGSSSGGGGILGTLGGFAGGLKSFFGFGDYSVPLNGGGASTGTAILQSGSLAQKLTALGRSNAALLGGGLLAADGLRRGGLAGLGETTGGGALIGFKFGGPLGAAIGAGVGALAGTIRLFVKSGAEKVIEKVKSRYGLTIDKGYAQQIYQIAKQNYGGNIDVALGAKEVQDLLSLYAENTGKPFGVANTPRGVSLSQAGGRLTQDATYVNGSAYSFQSNSGLGVTGGIATSLLSAPGRDALSGSLLPYQFPNSPNVTVIVQNSIPHQAVGEFLSGKVVETVAEQPRVVQKASNASLKGNFGRSNIQAALAPGVLTA
jgi:hypothetical protein